MESSFLDLHPSFTNVLFKNYYDKSRDFDFDMYSKFSLFGW